MAVEFSLVAVSNREEMIFLEATASVALRKLQVQKGNKVEASDKLYAALLQQLDNAAHGFPQCGGCVKKGCGKAEGREKFWQLCFELVGQCEHQALQDYVCRLHSFLTSCSSFIPLALKVGNYSTAILSREGKVEYFLSKVCVNYWLPKISQFAAEICFAENPSNQDTLDAWCACIKCLTLLHVVRMMHRKLVCALKAYSASETVADEWLCEDILQSPADLLASSLPRVLHCMYQRWWSSDESNEWNSATTFQNIKEAGIIVKVINFILCHSPFHNDTCRNHLWLCEVSRPVHTCYMYMYLPPRLCHFLKKVLAFL